MIGWTVYEKGCPIFKPFKGWQKIFNKGLEKNGYYGDLLDKYAIRNIKELKKGDKITVANLFGMEDAKVTKVSYKNKKAEAESHYNFYPLEFVDDAWCCNTMINKSCFTKALKIV